VIDKYEFLLSIKRFDFEIKELTGYCRQCCGCYELLQHKLDHLCRFMTCDENSKRWCRWGSHSEICDCSASLRETSVTALCDMEKYQSLCVCDNKLDISQYITALSESVKQELATFRIGPASKVLFVGSGALPVTALTIARELGAEVMCMDIDPEAVALGKRVAEVSGLGGSGQIAFSGQSLSELPYLEEATHIIIASLVKNKLEVIADVQERMNDSAKIILRYGNGLKSVFNYPLEPAVPGEWRQTAISRSDTIYDTLLLEKCQPQAAPLESEEAGDDRIDAAG